LKNFNAPNIILKNFVTSSSNLLRSKKNRLKSNKEWNIRSKLIKNRNQTINHEGVRIFEKMIKSTRRLYK